MKYTLTYRRGNISRGGDCVRQCGRGFPMVCSFVFRMIRKDYYKKHPEEEPHYGTMYVYDLNKSKNDEGGDVDEKRESD